MPVPTSSPISLYCVPQKWCQPLTYVNVVKKVGTCLHLVSTSDNQNTLTWQKHVTISLYSLSYVCRHTDLMSTRPKQFCLSKLDTRPSCQKPPSPPLFRRETVKNRASKFSAMQAWRSVKVKNEEVLSSITGLRLYQAEAFSISRKNLLVFIALQQEMAWP